MPSTASTADAPAGRPCPSCGVELRRSWVDGVGRIAGFWAPPPPVCARCEAQAADAGAVRAAVAQLGDALPPMLRGWSFDRVLKQRRGETLEALRERCAAQPERTIGITGWNAAAALALRDWIPGSESRPGRSIYLSGPVGAGKSTLVAALAWRLAREGRRVVYVPEGELFERCREETRSRIPGPRLVDLAAAADVLVLDDVGTTEDLRPWHRDVLEHLICRRYQACAPVLLTSNWQMRDLAGIYGERTLSRLMEMAGRTELVLSGYDWRSGAKHAQTGSARRPVAAASDAGDPRGSGAVPDPSDPPEGSHRDPPPDWRSRAAGDTDG